MILRFRFAVSPPTHLCQYRARILREIVEAVSLVTRIYLILYVKKDIDLRIEIYIYIYLYIYLYISFFKNIFVCWRP